MTGDLTGAWPVVGICDETPRDKSAETALDIVTSLVWQVHDRTRERDEARERLKRVEALVADWEHTVYELPPGYPMTVNRFCGLWFKEPLRAALDGKP